MTEPNKQPFDLTRQQKETLQEIANISINLTSDSLARMLKTFVTLSSLHITATDTINQEISNIVSEEKTISAIRQEFFSRWQGETISVYTQNNYKELGSTMGYTEALNKNIEIALLQDVSNFISSTCINNIAEQLNANCHFSPPQLIGKNIDIENLLEPKKIEPGECLLFNTRFHLEKINVNIHFFILISQESNATLKKDLDIFEGGL